MSEPVEVVLSPNALTTVERARSYLQKEAPGQDYELAEAIEFATAILETETRRRLRDRWYCPSVTLAGVGMTADSVNLTGTGFSAFREGMDVFHAGGALRYGSRLATVPSNTAATLTLAASTTAASQTITIGSETGALEFRHGGGREVLLPESPASEVTAVTVLGLDGTTTALSLSNSILRRESGILIMGDEYPACGDLLRVSFRAGYKVPTATDREHAQAWKRLEHLALRCVQIFWQDYRHEIGRSLEVNMRDQLLRFTSLKLPEDVREGIESFARWDL